MVHKKHLKVTTGLVAGLLLMVLSFSACRSAGRPADLEANLVEAELELEEGDDHDHDDHDHAENAPGEPESDPYALDEHLLENLDLSGRLVFLRQLSDGQSVLILDLEKGALETAFQAPASAWVTAATTLGSGQELLLAYAPAPGVGQRQDGLTDLSLLQLDGAGEPQTVIGRLQEQEAFSSPLWSPDGQYIYYSYYEDLEGQSAGARYSIGRQAYPGGKPEILAENAIWPRLSADGNQLVFVTFEPGAEDNQLMVIDLTNAVREPAQVLLPESFRIIDAPLFSPDGSMIYFSAPSPDAPTGSLSWLERLAGVQIAMAHNVPSEWWRVPTAGGEPERLTHIFDSGMYGDFSPDGKHMAFVSNSGLHVMDAGGGEVVTLIEAPDFYGTLDWIP